MKKGLFLLPVVGGLLLSGCTFTLFGKEITLGKDKSSESSNNNNNNNSNNNNNNNNNNSSSGDTTPTGTLINTVTLTNQTDKVSGSDTEYVFTNGKCSVTIGQGSSAQTVTQAATASKTYEFRVYQNFEVTFSATSSFKEILVKYSTYTGDSKTYYFDFDSISGATNVHNDTKGEALLTLSSAATSLSLTPYHQTRIASVSFYA